MRFTLAQIETFIEVANRGSFSAAARSLRRAQSSVSESIANLELALGTTLFDRSKRDPILTRAGEALLVEAEVLFDTALSFEGHGDSHTEGNPSELSIAVGLPLLLFTPVLVDFANKFPYINLNVIAATDQEASRLVKSGEANVAVALTRSNYDDGLDFRLLGRIIMCHVVLASHPLAEPNTLRFNTLRSHRRLALIDHARGLATSEYLQSPQTWTFQTYEALINATLAGVGWATVPRFLVEDRLRNGTLKELHLEAYPHTDWEVSIDLIWSKERPLGRAEQWLVDSFSEHRINDRIRTLTGRH